MESKGFIGRAHTPRRSRTRKKPTSEIGHWSFRAKPERIGELLMEVSCIRALRGPNLWSRKTAIEATVSCSDAEYLTSGIPDFAIRLRARFPDLDPFPTAGQYGRVTMAHALERVALGLQIQAGCLVEFSKTAQTLEPGIYQVVVEYSEEAVGRLALE